MPNRRPRPAAAIPAPLSVGFEGGGARPVHAIVSGQIDYAGVPSAQRQIVAAHNRLRSNDLMLDLTQVELMDSSGLRMILELRKVLAEKGGRLVLVAPSKAVRNILALTGVERHLEVTDTLAEARRLLSQELS